jgi:2-polyprenyl-3-methyl-5-hydroxy-6-metoxy-1,4-benzoquinol methylase
MVLIAKKRRKAFVTKISWSKSTADISCRLCGFEGLGQKVLRLKTGTGMIVNPVECPRCLSLDILPEPQHFSQTDLELDAYLEAGVGIDSIASMVSSMPRDSVKNFVDVGCGYGFSLAIARDIYGWNATGFEPSPLGVAGAEALGADIRNEFFAPGSQLAGSPDFILSSEVIEHVPDPLAFIETLRGQMPRHCVLLLSTPNRSVVYPEFPIDMSEMALSPGFHAFVASPAGMQALLQRAGFVYIKVREDGGTLFVSASDSHEALNLVSENGVSRSDIESWYASTAVRTEPGSSLRIALGRRLFDSLVATGNLTAAQECAESLRNDLVIRYKSADLDHLVRNATGGASSLSLSTVASLSYGMGIIALHVLGDANQASSSFATCIDAVRKWLRIGLAPNYHLLSLAREAHINRLISLARDKPDEAQQEALSDFDLVDIDRNYVVARVLVEAVSNGHDASVPLLAEACLSSVDNLLASDVEADRVAGQDALYMLAGMSERNNSVELATDLYVRCIDGCFSSPTVADHEVTLIRGASLALSRLGAPPHPTADDFLARVTITGSLPNSYLAIESYWRDASGIFVEGWAHLGATPLTSVNVSHGPVQRAADLKARPDLKLIYPDLPRDPSNGFRAYIPGGRGELLDVVLSTANGDMVIRWELPRHTLPAEPATEDPTFHDAFVQEAPKAPDGPVLAIGLRSSNAERLEQIHKLFGNREVVSLDIHEGPGVNVVGDVHNLHAQFPEKKFAIVYSEYLLEHLAMPWVAAAEMLRVLKPGGLLAHVVPWVWPTHAQPNDFFRFSAEGLQTLFSSEIGCSTIRSGGSGFARVIPNTDWRSPDHEDMPTLFSPSKTWIIAKKVSDAATSVSWPYEAEEGRLRAAGYPIEGIAQKWNVE